MNEEAFNHGALAGLLIGMAVGFGTYEPYSLRTSVTLVLGVLLFITYLLKDRNKDERKE